MAQTTMPREVRVPETKEHWATGVIAAVGLIGAGIGLWYGFADSTATYELFGWTASVEAAATWLAPLLLLGGGVLATAAMGTESIRDFRVHRTGATAVEALVALAGIVAIVMGVVALF